MFNLFHPPPIPVSKDGTGRTLTRLPKVLGEDTDKETANNTSLNAGIPRTRGGVSPSGNKSAAQELLQRLEGATML